MTQPSKPEINITHHKSFFDEPFQKHNMHKDVLGRAGDCIDLTTNPIIIILGIIFGAMAAALVIYGVVQSKRQQKSQAPPPTVSVPKPQKTEVRVKSSEPSDYFCQKCYAMISPDLEFCSECGAKQN